MSSCGGLLLLVGGGLLLVQFLGVDDVPQSGRLTMAVEWFVAVAVTVVALVFAVVGRWLELGQKRGRWFATAIFALVFAVQFLPPNDFWSDLGIATLMIALIATVHSAGPVRSGTRRR